MIFRRIGIAAAAIALLATHGALKAEEPLSVRLTSPLGRTGTPGAVRIVARVQAPSDTPLKPVRFLIDGVLLAEDADGPPYVAEWVDENPFERREIAVEVEDSLTRAARDTVVLEPFEVTEKTQVFSVLLEATVREKTGRFVVGLDRSRFSLVDEGRPQIPEIARQEAIPATFALLVDSSQSMSRRFDFVRGAAERLVRYLRPLDRVIVAPFSLQLAAVTGPTDDRETVVGAISAIKAGGRTAIFDSLKEMADRIAPLEGRKAILLITDGYDERSRTTLVEAVNAVKRSESTVYIVAIGGVAGISLRGERALKQLALETGGRAFFPPQIQDLPEVYDQLTLDAQNRYMLSFTPTNQKQDGSWRRVALSVPDTEYVVTVRDGYYAPLAPPIRPAIEFTVVDAKERYLDVTREDLVVREDGIEQTIDAFQEAVDPIQLVLTLDESGSMRKMAESVKAAASEFVRALRPADPLALITFSNKPRFAHDLSTVREWSLDAIAKYQTTGGTALYDALHDSILRLKSVKGRRAIVVLTDGRDENDAGTAAGSVHTLNEVMERAREVEAAIYPIGLGPNVDRAVLEQLAEISGGRAYFPVEVSQLAADYRAIVENLRRRYVLGYASSNRDRNGAWRRVEIIVRSTGLPAKSRGGYFAPEK